MDNGATALLSDRKTNAASSKSAVMSSNTWTRRLAPDAMNNRDEVVRTYVGSSGNGHGFICDNGTLTTLNVPVPVPPTPWPSTTVARSRRASSRVRRSCYAERWSQA
jgi:hypothetical protein